MILRLLRRLCRQWDDAATVSCSLHCSLLVVGACGTRGIIQLHVARAGLFQEMALWI